METSIATTDQPTTPTTAVDTHIPLFSFDTGILQSPLAQRAYRQGLLRAKSEALRTAQRLVAIGKPLLFGILFVSFVHLWYQVALIKPQAVASLLLPDYIYHVSAALLIISIDATALYIIACRGIGLYSGLRAQQRGVWFFFVLTALLNGMFVLTFSPNMPEFTTALLPALNFVIALLLALLIPVSILAVETAHQIAERTRLALVVEVATLQGLQGNTNTSTPAQSAPDSSAPLHPRDAILNLLALHPRKLTYAEVTEALAQFPRGTISHHLSRLVMDGAIQREGSHRNYRYFI